MTKKCEKCDRIMPETDYHDICNSCRKKVRKIKLKQWWDEHGGTVTFWGIIVTALSAAIGKAYVDTILSENTTSTSNCENDTDELENDENDKYPAGEKYWNKEKGRWEKDGFPYTYQVEWKDIRNNEYHEKRFNDIDQGYDYYEDKKKEWFTKDVGWKHIPPDGA